jgi:type IV secretory pathway TrbF-like protein
MKFIKRLRSKSINPYLQEVPGRREWNDLYDKLVKGRRHWQWAFTAVSIITIIQSIFMGKMAQKSAIEPFVVETNQGAPYAIQTVKAVSVKDSRIVNYALNQFIINVRSILNDNDAEKHILTQAYAFSAKQAKTFLTDYFNSHDPFKRSRQYTISVQIINSLPIGKNTWQITWDEFKKEINSPLISEKTRWMAQLRYELGTVNSHFLNENPFGIYVTELTWSENQIHEN